MQDQYLVISADERVVGHGDTQNAVIQHVCRHRGTHELHGAALYERQGEITAKAEWTVRP